MKGITGWDARNSRGNKYGEFVRRIAQENGCFNFEPEQIVWHYTDGPGLLGILESSQLHATQVSALNDAKETRHASELFISAIRELLAERATEPDVVAFLNSVISFSEENLEAQVRSKFFVTCFSGQEDDLNQWTGMEGGTDTHWDSMLGD